MELSQLLSIITFFYVIWAAGFSVLHLANAKERHPLLQVLAQLAIGLGTISFLPVILDPLHIPIHIITYLVLVSIVPVYAITKGVPLITRPKLDTIALHVLAVVLLMALTFLMFHKGAFVYPHLEDDDPWNHALGATYVAREHTYMTDPEVREIAAGYAFYLAPYPPTYDALMGVLRQTTTSLVWTLKFFNVVLLALAIGFCYLFLRTWLGNDTQALFASTALAVLPSFMSHFIWNQTLGVLMIPVGLYAIHKALDDKTWVPVAILMVASNLVTQPVASAVFGVLVLVYFLITVAIDATRTSWAASKRVFLIGAAGLAGGMLYWGYQLLAWGVDSFIKFRGGDVTGGGWAGQYALQQYSLWGVLFPADALQRGANNYGMIDQAAGWGLVIAVLAMIGIICMALLWRRITAQRHAYALFLIWFALLGYQTFAPSMGLPSWGAHRAWVYLAIPLAVFASLAAVTIANSASKRPVIRYSVVGALLVLVIATSLPAKLMVQQAGWGAGGLWASGGELQGYLRMQDILPRNTKVFPLCGADSKVIGMDMQSDPWDPKAARFKQTAINATGPEMLAFLDEFGYAYLTIDHACIRDHGPEAVQRLSEELGATGRLQQVLPAQGEQFTGVVLARVVRT